MVHAIILCSGQGTRLQNKKIKALVLVDKKPIFIHSILTFIKVKKIDRIFIVIPKRNESTFKRYLNQFNLNENVEILYGSDESRHCSLSSAINQIEVKYKVKNDDVFLTHDCARINVSKQIIEDNIFTCLKTGLASTVMPLSDSLVDKNFKPIDRQEKFVVQTPQSFKYEFWTKNRHNSIEGVTDLFSFLNVKLSPKNIVLGSNKNYKITSKNDL